MHKRVQIALALVLICIAGLITWQVMRLREPVYKGKTLSSWLDQYGSDADSPDADEALYTMGTNIIPALLEDLRYNDSALKLRLEAIGFRYTPVQTRHYRAQKGFSALGPDASNAVPALIEIYRHALVASAREAAANALVEIGPAASPAIPALIASTTSTNTAERAFALYTLGRMALQSEQVVPVLVKGLHDSNRDVRYQAAYGLANFVFMGGDAKPAIPTLLEALENDNYMGVRGGAAQALGHIHSESAVVVPALTKSLHDPDHFVRAQAATALGEFGANGQAAAATLTELLSDTNREPREAATKALKLIDARAAAAPGVK